MQSKNLAYLFTLLTILFWGGAATAFKTALQAVSPLALLASASTLSLLAIFFILVSQRKFHLLLKLSRREWLYLLLLGGINPFLYYVILFEAYDRLPGQVAMSLNYLWPVMLALLSVPILKHSLNMRSLMAILLSFIGAAIIASRGDMQGWNSLDFYGVLLALASTLVWALYWLFSARLAVDAAIKLFVGFLSGALLSLLYASSKHQLMPEIETYPWLAIGYVGLFEMGITFFIWLKALQLADSAATIGNMIYLTPFLSLILLAVFIHEPIHISTLFGLVIIISGILLQRKKN
jgi:drug/metabolite transporter (DMT)-like permease